MAKINTETYKVNEKSKPFYHKFDGDTAILFLHGFTDTNGNFLNQIKRLEEDRISCMGIRLPGHGTHYTDIDNYNFSDFVKCAEEALLKISEDYKNIYVVGFSIGGNIAFELAHKYPDKIKKLVVFGTPVRIPHGDLYKRLIPIVYPFYKFHKKHIPDWVRDQWIDSGAYEYFSLRMVLQIIDYLKASRELLPSIKVPTLVINIEKKDHLPSNSAEYIYDNLGSDIKKKVDVPGYHTEKDKNKVFGLASEFFGMGDFKDKGSILVD